MRIINRLVIGCFVVLGVLWAGAYVIDLRHRADDEAYYRQRVAPMVATPETPFDAAVMSQWLDRQMRHGDNAWFRTNIVFTGIAVMLGWTVITLVQTERFWRKRNAAHRPADSAAGTVIREARDHGSQLIARAGKDGWHFLPFHERDLEINFSTRAVVFRGFTFIRRFAGNRRVPNLTLPFTEILGGRIWASHGHHSLYLRTTAGSVTITDNVQPFSPVAAVLLDIAEVNRKSPTEYAAALARELKIKTPWYGWVMFAVALAAVAGFAAFLWHLQPK